MSDLATSGGSSGAVGDGRGGTTALSQKLPRRRPSGAPPPLPHHLHATGRGWLLAMIAVVGTTLLVFRNGLSGAAIPVTVVDDTVVRGISGVHAPGLYQAARMVTDVSAWWTIQVLVIALPLALLVLRRWRQLLMAELAIQVVLLIWRFIYEVSDRPRPFGVPLRAGWGGWAMPSEQMLAITGMLVLVLYTLVPAGKWRNRGKWVLVGLLSLVALARMYLGVDAPTDIAVAVVIATAVGIVGFRAFVPNEQFPVRYRQGRAAHLDVGGARGEAIRRAVEEQLGLLVTEVRHVGLSGSAGSTPLRLRVDGATPRYLFGKLYSRTHLRADAWYKIGRELLYGRLEDEKPFYGVRHLVQQEDYALRLVRDAGVAGAAPYGFVELTPDKEYLLITEFFDGAVELGEATVDETLIDDGLRVIRLLWNAGLAHRDIKPANLMVRDGKMLLIDVAFVEVRPTPWRQAVDLANMMLCLGLRSSAARVYERARLQFSEEEISEGFAAARGLALPSQLRRHLRAEGRGLHDEFLRLLPAVPQPIRVQRWTPRRVLAWMCLIAFAVLVGLNLTSIFGTGEASRTPLGVASLDCGTADKSLLWIEAQSVQSAAFVPCVQTLPVGWTVGIAYANSGRSGFTLDHDRAGIGTLDVTLTSSCDVRGAAAVVPDMAGARRFVAIPAGGATLERTWYEVFPGGCTTTRLHSQSARTEVNGEVGGQAPVVVGYATRSSLDQALRDRTDGRLTLDPEPAPGVTR